MTSDLRTQCCIVGCGPAGAMLGLLLARQGIDVIVVEKHGDFLRDFRGDDLTPMTMEVLDELGLASRFLDLGPRLMPLVEVHTPGGTVTLADLRVLPTRFPYIAVIPQWDFLAFITGEAGRCSRFQLLMDTEAVDVIEEGGAIRGVRCRSRGGTREVRATLTVAADGRWSAIRDRAGLRLVDAAPPVDLLWFRLPRDAGGGEEASIAVHLGDGRAMALLNRGDYWQVACVIPKESAGDVRAAGIDAFRRSIRRVIPRVGDHVAWLESWDQVSLLSVRVNRLRRWHRPGLLCIGDAAHAMSPIGGAGINFAIQDAVVAGNRLAGPLGRGLVTASDLAGVQRERAWQVRIMQFAQARMTAGVLLALEEHPGPVAGLVRRIGARLIQLRWLTAVRSRVIGLGIRRAHVAHAGMRGRAPLTDHVS
jgi:2-polyprenyl-6-methoxyphenol hydroxylase-like FAD-dependent oxidoreductase